MRHGMRDDVCIVLAGFLLDMCSCMEQNTSKFVAPACKSLQGYPSRPAWIVRVLSRVLSSVYFQLQMVEAIEVVFLKYQVHGD